MFIDLKLLRNEYQFSQVKLASESGVSLPTIQNIEAGKANPTIEVLEKILQTFGLQVQVLSPQFDAKRAVLFGVPLVIDSKIADFVVNKNSLKQEIRKWFHPLSENKFSERDELAVVAFLKAIKDHYPTFYRLEVLTPLFERMIEKYSMDGRVIKLRRISIANLSGYL